VIRSPRLLPRSWKKPAGETGCPLPPVLFLPLWELKPPVLLRLNHGQNKNENESEYALVAGSESEGVMMRMATRAKDLLHKLFEDGGELYKVTGYGVDGDCERALFYEINGVGRRRRSVLRL
jgi:hypothetical protein